MQIGYSDAAQKQLKKLPKDQCQKVLRKIQLLEKEPFLGKKLQGEFAHLRSFKAWPYRIIYYFSLSDKLLFIEAIEHRQGAYK